MFKALERQLEIVFKHFSVDEIFMWTYNRNGITQHIIQVHTQEKQRCHSRRERCERLLNDVDEYHFTFYNSKDIQNRINEGLGRLHLICRPENKIYIHPEHKTSIQLPQLTTSELIDQTSDYITQAKAKIIAFIDGYHLYYNSENYANAAFMLHQAIEISFRTAQKLLLGVEKRSHSIKQNIDCFKRFDPSLSNFCSTKEEELAISRLTESYTGSRYKQDFTMDLQKIAFCKDIADRVFTWIEAYEKELLEEIREKYIPQRETQQNNTILNNNVMEHNKSINNCHRDLILNALEIYGTVHGLYCFAYRSRNNSLYNLLNIQQTIEEVHHYYLFVIMSNQNRPIMDLQNCVMQNLPEKIKLTLIVETPEQVEKKLKTGDVFRTNLMQSAESWFKDREFIKEGETIPIKKLDIEILKNHWENRYTNARDLKFLPEEFACEVESRTNAFLLALSLEQTCIGLLYNHTNYTPTSTNLNYLMDLCEAFFPDISSIFGRQHEQQRSIFSYLVDAQKEYKYSSSFIVEYAAIEILIDNIKKFTKAANKFMQAHFKEQLALQEPKETETKEQCA